MPTPTTSQRFVPEPFMTTPFQHYVLSSLLKDHPNNPVNDSELLAGPVKSGLADYAHITHFYIQTYQQPGGSMAAKFDVAFLPEYDDDAMRMSFGAFPPNRRAWRLISEEDCRSWFEAEIANIVLAAWGRHPGIIPVSRPPPYPHKQLNGLADVAYLTAQGPYNIPLVIGVFKQSAIEAEEWLSGDLVTYKQKQLSRELREYAYAYDCPQVFCFDGKSFLMLQFRVGNPEYIKNPGCPVDCWVFPRENEGGCAIRYAFYRLMAQGLRRYQSFRPLVSKVAEVPMYSRLFFSGQPVWRVGNDITETVPGGFVRQVDRNTGSFYWTYMGPCPYPDEKRLRIIDTGALWDGLSR